MPISTVNIRKLALILLLGFSSGLPLALSGATLQAWFTTTGISIVAIGELTLVGQPYIYKFLWAPLLDRYIPPLLGRRRGWLIITQLGLIIAIAAMAFGDPNVNPYLLAGLGVAVAFISATQDIAFDAYRTDILTEKELGLGAALTTAGYRIAMLVSGGLALVLAAKFGWRVTYLIMASLMLIGLLASWLSEEPVYSKQKNTAPENLWVAIKNPFQEFLKRKAALLILLFIVLYKIGDAFSLSLMTPFLIRGLGFSLTTVGMVFKGFGFLATIAGASVAGLIMIRLSLYRSLFLFGVAQIIAILMLYALALVGKNYLMLVTAIVTDSFCNGMGSTALVAYLMSLCDHRYTATQFALLSAFASIGRILAGPIAGILVTHISWTSFFICAVIISIPSLILLKILQPHIHMKKSR